MAAETPDDQYDQVYRATYDAMWAVVGEMVYALILAALFFVGLQVVVASLTGFAGSPATVVFAVLGLGLVVVTAHRFAKLFDLLPWS